MLFIRMLKLCMVVRRIVLLCHGHFNELIVKRNQFKTVSKFENEGFLLYTMFLVMQPIPLVKRKIQISSKTSKLRQAIGTQSSTINTTTRSKTPSLVHTKNKMKASLFPVALVLLVLNVCHATSDDRTKALEVQAAMRRELGSSSSSKYKGNNN